MVLEVTRICAGILVIVWVILMLMVIQIRSTNRVSMGDGGIPKLKTRIRAHANFVENTPFFLLILAIVELGVDDIPSYILYIFGIGFVIGRIVHGIGFSGNSPSTPARIIGTTLTFIPIICLGIYGLCGWNIYGHIFAILLTVVGFIVRMIVIPRMKPVATSGIDQEYS